jgi:hypothetical protein
LFAAFFDLAAAAQITQISEINQLSRVIKKQIKICSDLNAKTLDSLKIKSSSVSVWLTLKLTFSLSFYFVLKIITDSIPLKL